MCAIEAAVFAILILATVIFGVLESGATGTGDLSVRAWIPALLALGLLLVRALRTARGGAGRLAALEDLRRRAGEVVSSRFLVKPCARCQQSAFRLLRCTPLGRSLQYQCLTCERRYWAAACAPESQALEEIIAEIESLVARCEGIREEMAGEVLFQTPEAPLPYELTTREPIPEATRAEVWRRDLGRCVRCGSSQGLQFDHIIPVSKGGATTAPNLQLLCQGCNLQKGAAI